MPRLLPAMLGSAYVTRRCFALTTVAKTVEMHALWRFTIRRTAILAEPNSRVILSSSAARVTGDSASKSPSRCPNSTIGSLRIHVNPEYRPSPSAVKDASSAGDG